MLGFPGLLTSGGFEMLKWIVLGLGVFLFVNGSFARTYGYADPEQYCFQMDLINFWLCQPTPTIQVVPTGAMVLGGALILGCVLVVRRQRLAARRTGQ